MDNPAGGIRRILRGIFAVVTAVCCLAVSREAICADVIKAISKEIEYSDGLARTGVAENSPEKLLTAHTTIANLDQTIRKLKTREDLILFSLAEAYEYVRMCPSVHLLQMYKQASFKGSQINCVAESVKYFNRAIDTAKLTKDKAVIADTYLLAAIGADRLKSNLDGAPGADSNKHFRLAREWAKNSVSTGAAAESAKTLLRKLDGEDFRHRAIITESQFETIVKMLILDHNFARDSFPRVETTPTTPTASSNIPVVLPQSATSSVEIPTAATATAQTAATATQTVNTPATISPKPATPAPAKPAPTPAATAATSKKTAVTSQTTAKKQNREKVDAPNVKLPPLPNDTTPTSKTTPKPTPASSAPTMVKDNSQPLAATSTANIQPSIATAPATATSTAKAKSPASTTTATATPQIPPAPSPLPDSQPPATATATPQLPDVATLIPEHPAEPAKDPEVATIGVARLVEAPTAGQNAIKPFSDEDAYVDYRWRFMVRRPDDSWTFRAAPAINRHDFQLTIVKTQKTEQTGSGLNIVCHTLDAEETLIPLSTLVDKSTSLLKKAGYELVSDKQVSIKGVVARELILTHRYNELIPAKDKVQNQLVPTGEKLVSRLYMLTAVSNGIHYIITFSSLEQDYSRIQGIYTAIAATIEFF